MAIALVIGGLIVVVLLLKLAAALFTDKVD